MSSKVINITLPEELVKEVDKAAKQSYSSRSDYIRESLVHRLKGQRVVDEWGDEGVWESIADFREINPEGVPIEDVISILRGLDEKDEKARKAPSKARR